MYFILIEMVFLIAGIYAIFSAKVPSFLVGGGKYHLEGAVARLFGAILIVPLPVAFLSGIVLTFLFGDDGTLYAMLLEFLTLLGCGVFATILARVAGERVEPATPIEATIAKKAQGAMMYAIFSMTGFAALIGCPLAILYANQALKLMVENKVGEQHRGKAEVARVLAIIGTALWAAAIIGALALGLLAIPR